MVSARSLTMSEAMAHQERIRSKMDGSEVMARLVTTCCTVAGEKLFADHAEAMQADNEVIEQLIVLVMEANGQKAGENVPDPTKSPA